MKLLQKKQEEILAKQEQRAEAQEASQSRRLSASARARRTGGIRMLLSPDRDDAQLGLSDTLGG